MLLGLIVRDHGGESVNVLVSIFFLHVYRK